MPRVVHVLRNCHSRSRYSSTSSLINQHVITRGQQQPGGPLSALVDVAINDALDGFEAEGFANLLQFVPDLAGIEPAAMDPIILTFDPSGRFRPCCFLSNCSFGFFQNSYCEAQLDELEISSTQKAGSFGSILIRPRSHALIASC
jgi:hypothetical protein